MSRVVLKLEMKKSNVHIHYLNFSRNYLLTGEIYWRNVAQIHAPQIRSAERADWSRPFTFTLTSIHHVTDRIKWHYYDIDSRWFLVVNLNIIWINLIKTSWIVTTRLILRAEELWFRIRSKEAFVITGFLSNIWSHILW